MVFDTNNMLAGSAILLGVTQMALNIINIDDYKIDKHTHTYLYLGILASSTWLIYQYRKGANYSALYSTIALLSQLFILHKVNSKERERVERY